MCVFHVQASPCDAKAYKAHTGQDIVDHVAFSSTDLEVDIKFCELQQDVVDVMEEQHQEADVVKPLEEENTKYSHVSIVSLTI